MSAWVTFPPIFSVPVAAVLFLTGGQVPAAGIGAPFWALLMIIYFLITAVYGLAINRGLIRLLAPLQLLSQGLIVAGISLEAGSLPIIAWVGVIAAVSGAFVLLNQFLASGSRNLSGEAAPPSPHDSIRLRESSIGSIPLPALTVDSAGAIIEEALIIRLFP